MTATTRRTECTAAEPTLYLAFELGSTKWTLAFATSPAQRPRLREIAAGDLAALTRECTLARERLGVAAEAPLRSCYEAGRDGFWLHRWLTGAGVRNLVVDSSSIQVDRRARRAKTDRLDATKLVTSLMRWAGGEQVWSVVQVPTPEAEAARQVIREIETVRQDRQRVRNRLHAVLAVQGIRCPLGQVARRLDTLTTGDGRRLPGVWQGRLERDLAQLRMIEARLRQLRAARAAALAATDARVATVAEQLATLRGLGETGASLCSAELFGSRRFRNGREVGALIGLVPVPYRSDQRVQDQGLSKTGRRQLRRVSVQLAWGWLRYQPTSALTLWFYQRFGTGGRSRRVGIVAVARKLMVALWRFTAHGELPAGARLKTA